VNHATATERELDDEVLDPKERVAVGGQVCLA
jgi:hypothetical protein